MSEQLASCEQLASEKLASSLRETHEQLASEKLASDSQALHIQLTSASQITKILGQ